MPGELSCLTARTHALIDSTRSQTVTVQMLASGIAVFTIFLSLVGIEPVPAQTGTSALQESQNQPTSPKRMLDSSLQKQIEVLGPDHPHVAITLNSLAEYKKAQGEPREAISLYRRAIDIWEQSEESASLNLAKMLNGLAGAYREAGNDAAAYQVLVRSLRIRERIYGPAHIEVAIALNNLGVLAEESGRLEDAVRIYGRAIRIMENKQGPERAAIISMLSNQGTVLEELGRKEEAVAAYQRADLFRSRLGGSN